MIELQNISKIYPVGEGEFYALKDVCLTIQEGEFVAIRGASGSGKTTLLNIIGCLDDPSQGVYTLNGNPVAVKKDREKSQLRNREIGFVLQDFALISQETVYFNVMLPLLFSSVPYGKIRKMVRDALEVVGIGNQEKKLVNQLSGGQRQRVAIARAIVTDPRIILADEPTGQLDSQTGQQIMELLSRLNCQGKTVVVVTHDETVAACAKRQIWVRDGCVLE